MSSVRDCTPSESRFGGSRVKLTLTAYCSRSAKGKGAETTEGLPDGGGLEGAEERGAHSSGGFGVFLGGSGGCGPRTQKRLARVGLRPPLELYLVHAIEMLEREHSTWGRARFSAAVRGHGLVELPGGS